MSKQPQPTALDTALLLEHGINTSTNSFDLVGTVNEEMYTKTIRAIQLLSNVNPAGLIRVALTTTGGEAAAALAIYEALRSHPRPIHVQVIGSCLSAGGVILQAGYGRSATVLSRFLLHQGPQGSDNYDENKENQRIDRLWIKIMAKRSNISEREMSKLHERETYFGTKRALELGLIDEVHP